jgi:hypothetical protein
LTLEVTPQRIEQPKGRKYVSEVGDIVVFQLAESGRKLIVAYFSNISLERERKVIIY